MHTPAPCRHCLLEELPDEQSFYAMIQERVRLLPDSERAEPGEYRRRLALCRACDQLVQGTCSQCGCYVEIRAAKRLLHCAHTIQKW